MSLRVSSETGAVLIVLDQYFHHSLEVIFLFKPISGRYRTFNSPRTFLLLHP